MRIPQEVFLKERYWKTLIVQDACRYDYFTELHELLGWPGILHQAENPHNNTADWLNYELPKAGLEDLTMIAGTPVAWAHCRGVVAALQEAILLSRQDNEDNFAHPKLCMGEARRILEEDPKRRLFIHLTPPHLPFMGPKGDAFLRKLYRLSPTEKIGIRPNIYNDIQRYAVRNRAWPEIVGHYKENIEVGMNAILESDFLPRPIGVTSDHGELVGENNIYRHYTMDVPWLVIT